MSSIPKKSKLKFLIANWSCLVQPGIVLMLKQVQLLCFPKLHGLSGYYCEWQYAYYFQPSFKSKTTSWHAYRFQWIPEEKRLPKTYPTKNMTRQATHVSSPTLNSVQVVILAWQWGQAMATGVSPKWGTPPCTITVVPVKITWAGDALYSVGFYLTTIFGFCCPPCTKCSKTKLRMYIIK